MIDVTGDGSPEFEPTNVVEQQLLAAANGDLEQQKAFERFILDETLYVATPEAPAEESVTVSQGESIRLLNVLLDDGRQAAAVFTAPQRVAEAFGEVGAIGIQGRILFEMIRATPAVLNPGQPYSVVWEPDTMAAMLGLPAERVVTRETKITLGFPADPPMELIERLRTVFATVPEVEAAWLALAEWTETGAQSWYLDVRTSSADREPILRALPSAVEGAEMDGRPLDLVINPVAQAEGLGIVIVEPGDRPKTAKKKGLLGRLFR